MSQIEMTKEYIGEAFRAPYCAAMAAWYAGGMIGRKPVIEFFNRHCKPAPKRMVTMYTKDGPVELVAPERKAPVRGTTYFLTFISGVEPDQWTGINIDQERLASGKIFLTREDAQEMDDFQRKQRLGDV